jgi:hypothetical protein
VLNIAKEAYNWTRQQTSTELSERKTYQRGFIEIMTTRR